MEYYLAIKKNEKFAICSNMDGLRDYHTKWRKSDRERQILYDIAYTWNLKENTNELIHKQKETHRHRKKNKQTTYGYQKGKSGENKLGGWD